MATARQETQSQTVLVERAGGAVTLRLNRPEKLNALDAEACRSLVHALLEAGEDKSVRVIVLPGAGRASCAGGDLDVMREARSRRAVGELQKMLAAGKELCLAIATMPKLVVAAVNGPAGG